ncbi:cell division protein FtsQ/DivIB [Zunongwangia sp. F363]|uniref:Cell division protein FtsQ/DivIB n=1 Tax=Autumnicola tepida TaxID=3075595 RepID=A0ABU3C7T7_9FLAO|nr:cell division protein FtsQ/DivIB [Zunongwangia sp. F363]MDT0642397.1 cell division protein FtsQ/DivIB [Zunongwangia sp. F363]
MRASLGYIKAILLIALVAFLFGFAEKRQKSRKISEVAVKFTDTENLYVTEEAVNKLLIQNKVPSSGIGKETLDLNRVEGLLNKHEMIENAEVYVTLDGKLEANVSQRKPIGRVVGNSSFYLDRNGELMPLSQYYSARVPLLMGFDGGNVKEVYPLLEYIRKDEFLTQHITGITRVKPGRFNLQMRKMDFTVYMGDAENIELKFNNFKAFYKKALKDDKLGAYRKVNLQFGNQVVCTKK